MSEENNYTNENCLLDNIKSKIILKKIFENISVYKYVNLIRYNNHLQKKLKKSLDDYKALSKIEIEIFPIEEKYGEIINYKY